MTSTTPSPTSRKRILVTGANGFVGRSVCQKLSKENFIVRAAVRSQTSLQELKKLNIAQLESVEVGDITESTDWRQALQGVDAVIHLANRAHVMHETASDALSIYRKVNVAGTEYLAKAAAAASVPRLLYLSTIKVNGEFTPNKESFNEQNHANPQDFYALSKWEAELSLYKIAQSNPNFEIIILRPPLIYGPCVKANFLKLLSWIERGVPIPLKSINNGRSLIYLENLTDAIMKTLFHPQAANQTYVIADNETVSTTDLMQKIADLSQRPARLLALPPRLLNLIGSLTGKSAVINRLTQSLRINNEKIKRDLNWQPPFTLEEGLAATLDWYKNSLLPRVDVIRECSSNCVSITTSSRGLSAGSRKPNRP